MPMHDWANVNPGTYHDFHQDWTIEVRRQLNAGRLPAGYFAMTDQHVIGPIPDVITLEGQSPIPVNYDSSIAVKAAPPKSRLVAQFPNANAYARRANSIRVVNTMNRVVAAIEIVSRGNKTGTQNIKDFISKLHELITRGIHVLVVDPFPPTKHDHGGLHQLLCSELGDETVPGVTPEKPLLAFSVDAQPDCSLYAECFAAGDSIPQMPLFLAPGQYVDAPLEESYVASWNALPEYIRQQIIN